MKYSKPVISFATKPRRLRDHFISNIQFTFYVVFYEGNNFLCPPLESYLTSVFYPSCYDQDTGRLTASILRQLILVRFTCPSGVIINGKFFEESIDFILKSMISYINQRRREMSSSVALFRHHDVLTLSIVIYLRHLNVKDRICV